VTSIHDIVDAVANPYTPWRTLKELDIVCDNEGPLFITGNASVIFTAHHQGQKKILKCYTRHNPYLGAIYGKEFHPAELCVSDITGRRYWVDCLLTDYIEGVSLHEKLCQSLTPEELHHLAEAFDQMAAALLDNERAHGDIKPENIIVCPDGELRLVDWDAAFVPVLQGRQSLETGTAAYQHPLRTTALFDKHIDDYSIAFLSTLLHAYAAAPEMAEYYRQHHQPQIHPREIYRSRLNYNCVRNILRGTAEQGDWLHTVTGMFAERCMPRQYHIARMLRDSSPQLFLLKRLFDMPEILDSYDEEQIEANVWHGLWGYSTDAGWVVAPLFDECNDPREGILQVRLAEHKHLLRCNGERIATVKATDKVRIQHGVISLHHSSGEPPFEEIIL
jgi:predicted Ser/Thr protein kinase